jgi:hypothetical protein
MAGVSAELYLGSHGGTPTVCVDKLEPGSPACNRELEFMVVPVESLRLKMRALLSF